MTMDRVKVQVNGTPGGNGTMNWYFVAATAAGLTALGNLMTAMRPYIPNTVTYVIPGSGDTINDADGHLSGTWTAASPGSYTGTGGQTAAAPTGLLIDWKAATVVDSHRPIAKAFFVPCSTAAVGTNGMAAAAAITAINAAAATFLGASTSFGIWHRPKYNYKTDPPTLVRTGTSIAVASGTVNSKLCVLRSRRD